MNTKKIIIIVVAIVLVFVVTSKNKKTTEEEQKNAEQNASTPTYKPIQGSNGANYQGEFDNPDKSSSKNQNKVTMNAASIDYVANRINDIYNHWLYDYELNELNSLIKRYVFTRADVETLMQAVPQWSSWIEIQRKDGFRPYFSESKESEWIPKFNKTLKENGVDFQF